VSYDDWPDEPGPYLSRDDPRCRRHPTELESNCRPCRSEAIADPDREPENLPAAGFANRPKPRGLRVRPTTTEEAS
jgi:hypothetical protein